MRDTFRLMETATKYIEANKEPAWIMAYAGGSVGRGDADCYSDLDLNIIVSSPVGHKSVNLSFEQCDIQLHVHSWSGSDTMRAAPWRHRYLSEARSVYDPYNVLGMLKPAAIEYFRSDEGRGRMLRQAHEEVQQFLHRLDDCLRDDEQMGAAIAVHEAWHAAAASFVWMNRECCSGGALLGHIRAHLPSLCDVFLSIALEHQATADEMLDALSYYRHYLRGSVRGECFALDPVMDRHIARKAARYADKGETDGLRMLIRNEALWCYAASGGGIEQFGREYRAYPAAVREALASLGCFTYTSVQMSELLRQIEQLTDSAQKAV